MSLYENINKRKKAGTSRSKKSSTVSDESYAKMKAGFRSGGMVNQMSDQMDVPKQEARNQMAKAKKKNDAEGYQMGGMLADPMRRLPGTGSFERTLTPRMGYFEGGSVYDVTHGSEDVPIEWGREKLKGGTEELIQSTENQVRGRYFNNNNGKGTF